ncbi:MAG: hypothetical protein II534_08275 [Clostridia bacterium]|nr:hypothetical protein [Clostridia bacterium]
MKKILSLATALVFVVSLLSVFATATDAPAKKDPQDYLIEAIYGTPIVDGDIDDIWKGARINMIEQVFQTDDISPMPVARYRVMYDEFYLYFLVEVTDTTIGDAEWEAQSLGGNLWRRDGVSMTFSPDNNRDITNGQVAPAFWFIIASFGNTANWNSVPLSVFITEKEGLEPADAGDFTKLPMEDRMYAISYKTDATGAKVGYVLENKVNLKPRYEGIKMEAGTKIGYDIYINDNNPILFSTSRNNGLTWTGDVNSYKNNATKGTIELQAKNITFTNDDITEPPVTTAEVTTEEVTTAEVTSGEVTTEEVTTAAGTAEEPTAAASGDDATKAPEVTTAPAGDGGCKSSAAPVFALIAAAALIPAAGRKRR